MVAADNPILGRRWRGDGVETVHRGCWVVVADDGRVLAGAGDPDQMVFARSASKSLQALALIDSGAIDRFEIPFDELAVTVSSHSGEPVHIAGVRSLLARVGLDESHLRCGPSTPWFDPRAESVPIHHCCSGKHAGFLAASIARGEDPERYLDPDSPLQQRVLELVLDATTADPKDVRREIDGCSAPTFHLPLRALARGIARITNPSDLSPPIKKGCERLAEAAALHPHMVGGSDPSRFDSAIIEATGGRLFSKEGAEGVLVIGVVGGGAAFSGKVDDGSLRALWPVAAQVLSSLGHLDDSALGALQPWIDPVIRNTAGLVTGHLDVETTTETG